MIRLSRDSRPSSGLDTTSLADIIFLLLLFYILSSTLMTTQGLMVRLPQAASAQRSPSTRFIDLVAGADGTIILDGVMIPVEALQGEVLKTLDRRGIAPADLQVRVYGDCRAEFQFIVRVIDGVKMAGVRNIMMVSSEKESGQPR